MSDRPKRVMILSAGVGSGHNAAATALEAELAGRPGVAAVQSVDVLGLTSDLFRSLQDDGYFTLVDAAPWIVGWGYDMNDVPFRIRGAMSVWDQLNTTAVVKRIRAFAPDTAVCTHYLPARLVSLLLGRGRLQATMSVVTTDYDFQGMWLTAPFNRLYVARDETRVHMVEIGLPGDRITVSGIPVGRDFSVPADRESVLARYELSPDVPTLLISAGAAGGEYTRAVVTQTLAIEAPFQAVVVCGRNEQLREAVTALVASNPGRYRVIGYTTEMAALMRVATLFVGKPGGLSSSECMAAGLPMVLINPIPGQEVRNSDFLLEEGAAVRCNYGTTIGYKIATLLEAPERLARMAASARRAAPAALDQPRGPARDPRRRATGAAGTHPKGRGSRQDRGRRVDGCVGRTRDGGRPSPHRPLPSDGRQPRAGASGHAAPDRAPETTTCPRGSRGDARERPGRCG